MQPVKITIYGDYFDCQIYRRRLYLWTFDGVLKVYQWDDIVKSLIKKGINRISLSLCFMDGSYLYRLSSIDLFKIELFKDVEFRTLLLNKFQKVSNQEYQLTTQQIDKFIIGEQETPTNYLPTDTEIYNSKLHFITEQGLFVGSAHRSKSNKYPVSPRPKKLWDCNLLSIKANNYSQLSLSGGSEGLYELNLSKFKPEKLKTIEANNSIFQVSNNHSSFSNYTSLSIYNSSVVDNSFMALFNWNTKKDRDNKEIPQRDYQETINESNIFKTNNKDKYLSWGADDKIYRGTDNGFEIVRFNNYAKTTEGENFFSTIKKLNLHPWKGKIISGGTAHFGTIIECENALVVMLSNGENYTIPGPITRWRVYPRSKNYENHLHVIHENRIEIYSFNHDYFLNQDQKELGIKYKPEKNIRTNTAKIGYSKWS